MTWELAGLGNALIDALVVLEDDTLIEELGLVRGTMHPVDHHRWQEVYERVRRRKVTFDSGGSCANTIATLGYLGARATYCGQVGEDQMGQMYASALTEACGTHALQWSDDRHTGKCLSIISAADAERTMLTDLGAAVSLPSLGDFAGILADTRVAHFTGYTLLDGPMRQVVMEAMHVAHEAGAIVSIDAADPFVVRAVREILWNLLRDYASIVFLNADEAEVLTGLPPEEAAPEIAERGQVDTVVVKLGARGSLVLEDGRLHKVGIRPVKALDTTGAGDAYAGGYLYGVVQGWTPADCARLAASVAALTVAQVGAVVKDRAALAELVREVREGDVPDALAQVGA